jgi:hypothetical protein
MDLLERATVTLIGPAPTALSTVTLSTISSLISTSATATYTLVDPSIGASTASTSNSTASNTGAAKVHPSSFKSLDGKSIIGGVIGGVAFIALCALFFWIVLRGRRQKKGQYVTRQVRSPADWTADGIWNGSSNRKESGKRRSGGVFAPFGGQ